MKKRKLAGFISVMLLLSMFFMGCPTGDDDADEDNGKKPPVVNPDPYTPVPIGNYSGTDSGTADGFARSPGYLDEHVSLGAPIIVTVTMLDGWITAVTINGPNESDGVGSVLVTKLGPLVVKYNTFGLDSLNEDDIDGIAGATLTFNGIKEAGEDAINKIKASSP